MTNGALTSLNLKLKAVESYFVMKTADKKVFEIYIEPLMNAAGLITEL